jgi:hypothetical protein
MRKNLLALVLMAICSLLMAQQAMNNAAVIKLVKAGLSEDLIVDTINATPGTYDTSADGLTALRSAGASARVIAAVLMKASRMAAAPAPVAEPSAAPAAPVLPPGIHDPGLYYQDRSGVWQPMKAEIVDFEGGGVLKVIGTAGFTKGEIDGHIDGAHSELTLKFPAMLAVYVPEGSDMGQYQLVRLHVKRGSREFRSVTGGLLHASGGAKHDAVDFDADKIAPGVYQIKLQIYLGAGEYGLLPPGAYNNSGRGSNGKIYTLGIE